MNNVNCKTVSDSLSNIYNYVGYLILLGLILLLSLSLLLSLMLLLLLLLLGIGYYGISSSLSYTNALSIFTSCTAPTTIAVTKWLKPIGLYHLLYLIVLSGIYSYLSMYACCNKCNYSYFILKLPNYMLYLSSYTWISKLLGHFIEAVDVVVESRIPSASL